MNYTQEKIKQKLRETEAEQRVKIVHAAGSGSRGWGFPSPDSNYDCRFIYMHSREWYLSVFAQKDTMDFSAEEGYRLGGWDVRKVIRYLVKPNAVMMELLSSGIVYRKEDKIVEELKRLGNAFFDPVAISWHYLSMAKHKLAQIIHSDEIKIRNYFYMLRPLACLAFIRTHGKMPYMEFPRNLAEIQVPEDALAEIKKLQRKKEGCKEGEMLLYNPVLMDYFRDECEAAAEWLSGKQVQKNRDYGQADETFRRILEMNR